MLTRVFPAMGLAVLGVVGARAKPPKVLVTVNGVSISREEVTDRAFRQFGTSILNEMADEILIRQAAKQAKVEADAAEVSARLQRIRGQFPDEKTFNERIAAIGLTAEELRARISAQILREGLVASARKLSVGEAETRDFFEANKDKLGAQEALRIRHLLVATEKEANDFLVALQAGADFARLAASVSLDAGSREKGGDLGLVSRGMLQGELEAAVFGAKVGGLAGPVRTQLGFHIFKVEELRPAKAVKFEEVRADLLKALLADKIGKAWPAYLQELRDKAKYVAPK